MHIIGALFLTLILGVVLSPMDAIGVYLYDRRYGR